MPEPTGPGTRCAPGAAAPTGTVDGADHGAAEGAGGDRWMDRRRVDPPDPALVEIRRVQPVMGTVVSIAAWARADHPAPVEAAVVRGLAWLHEVDDRFTTWRPSE